MRASSPKPTYGKFDVGNITVQPDIQIPIDLFPEFSARCTYQWPTPRAEALMAVGNFKVKLEASPAAQLRTLEARTSVTVQCSTTNG
jgi:hypothetical protein